MTFAEKLKASIVARDSLVCVGLDPDIARIAAVVPDAERRPDEAATSYLRAAIDATVDLAAAFKINKAFFDPLPNGRAVLAAVLAHIHRLPSSPPVILDCKVGDTENTMRHYFQSLFGLGDIDAVLLNPYMGDDVWRGLPSGRAAGVLVRTSNPAASSVQDLPVAGGGTVWRSVLGLVVRAIEDGTPLFPVVSLSLEEDAHHVRRAVPQGVPILFAGVGAQGAAIAPVRQLLDRDRGGVVVNSSRAILYPDVAAGSDWRASIQRAALALRTQLQELRRGQ